MKKIAITFGVLIGIALLLLFFRVSLLRSVGNYLICEDELSKSEAIFVLSGGTYDRGLQALRLYNDGVSKKIICTGENVPNDFECMGLNYKESLITSVFLLRKGVKLADIDILPFGTSTKEEVDLIVSYCKRHCLKKVIIVSNKFHTRRIYRSVRKAFVTNDIQVLINGAPSTNYKEGSWWKFENGLITVNNEYIKLLYYFIKY
ncbi:MAG: YdcF family protein [Bacteroidota bacterium]